MSNVYNNQNQPTGSGGLDAAGNPFALGTYSIAYDAENRELSVSDSTGTEVQVGYDALGQRVTKNGTVYVYDALGNFAAEYNGSPAATVACGTCYLSSDYLGSGRLVTDSQDVVVSRHDYLPFGDEIDANAAGRHSEWGATSDNIAQRFTGQARDRETAPSLEYFHARYYSSAIARFTSVDPGNLGASITNPQSWNAYAYVLNSRLINTDPDRTDICSNGSYADACVVAPPPPDVSLVWSLSGDLSILAPITLDRTGVPTISALPAQAPPPKSGTPAPNNGEPHLRV